MNNAGKGLTAAAAIFTIIAGVFAVLQYNKAEKPSVQADNGSVAVGGDVGGDVKLNTYDFDARLREQAESYVRAAGSTCKDTLSSIESLTPDSDRNMMEVAFTVPVSLQMTEEAAAYYGDDAANEIETRIEALANTSVEFNKIYMHRSMQSMTAKAIAGYTSEKSMKRFNERSRRKEEEDRASFDANKKALLESTAGLCTYIQSMRPARKTA